MNNQKIIYLMGILSVSVFAWFAFIDTPSSVSVSIEKPVSLSEQAKRNVRSSSTERIYSSDYKDPNPVAQLVKASSPSNAQLRENVVRIMDLNTPLNSSDIDHLLNYIGQLHKSNDSHHAAAVNEAVNLLHRQKARVKELPDYLLKLVNNAQQPPIIRDYAIQHLGRSYLSIPQDLSNQEQKEQIVNALWSNIQENTELSATAALALHDSTFDTLNQPIAGWDEYLNNSISNGDVHSGLRMAAIHILTDRQDSSAISGVRSIAEDNSVDTTLRKAAIHYIGNFGVEADQDLLNQLSNIPAIERAVKPALKRLTSKFNSQ